MYKLAIFDLDGTLLDTLDDLANASNVALREYGFEEHEVYKYKTFVGDGVYKLVERMLPESHRDEETKVKVKAAFDSYYEEHNLDYTRPYEGILDVLKNLREEGIHTAVVSNKPHAFTQELVKRMFGETIELAYGQRESVPTKPDPYTVEEVIRYFGIKKEECIYIGDTNVDIFTGKNAGVETVGVLWGFRSREELLSAGAEFVVERMDELRRVIIKESY